MDRKRTLAQFDEEMRRNPPDEAGYVTERQGSIVRQVGEHAWISYFRLTDEDAPRIVEEEAELFRRRGRDIEWKVYDHDGPATLSALLAVHGFVPDTPETLMVLDLHDPSSLGPSSPAVEVREVTDRAGLEAAVGVSRVAFSPGPGWELEEYLPKLGTPGFAAFLATVHGEPVSAGRLDMPTGRSFASIWGGGTVPKFRGAGIYRALVAARANLARARGYRYLTVDARETSRPILERNGFQPLDGVVGWVLSP